MADLQTPRTPRVPLFGQHGANPQLETENQIPIHRPALAQGSGPTDFHKYTTAPGGRAKGEADFLADLKVDTGEHIADETSDPIGTPRVAAQSAVETGKRVYEHAHEKMDEFIDFVRQRQLLAIGISFSAGYLIARVFRR